MLIQEEHHQKKDFISEYKELLEEFEECNGYEMGEEFLFAFLEDTSSYADPDYPFTISINPKSLKRLNSLHLFLLNLT